MKFTDEQRVQIGRGVVDKMLPHLPNGITWIHEYRGDERAALLAAGSAAVAAVAPLLLAEPLPEEMGIAGADYLCFNGVMDRDYREVLRFTLKNFVSNRLASLTAKPDPAVEAVKALWLQHDGNASAEQIVAAVDAARAK